MQLPPPVHCELLAIHGTLDAWAQREQVELIVRDAKSFGRTESKIRS
jgi:hypothetical protein